MRYMSEAGCSSGAPDILEQLQPSATDSRSLTIGLPASGPGDPDRRFPLTPEGVAILTDRGYRIKIEEGAAAALHFADAAFTRAGAEVTSRAATLAADIVIHLSPLATPDIMQMRRGTMLLTLLRPEAQTRDAVRALLDRHIIAVALDLVEDTEGNTPFADILSEIDGRTAITAAASLLSAPYGGKGILLGGVAGIVPCEVTIFGSGIAARAAARSAFGLGAMVRMFDNDVYSLRRAARDLGQWVIGSALHPHVVENALSGADVVVNTLDNPARVSGFSVDADMSTHLKREAIVFDLAQEPGGMFPSLRHVALVDAAASAAEAGAASKVCMTHVGSATPRSAAMALTNTFVTLLHDLTACDGATNALRLLPGFQRAAYTFLGKAVNRRIARIADVRPMDINMFLSLS